MRLRLRPAAVPPSLEEIVLTIEVAGQMTTMLLPSSTETYAYTWDGRDAYGRPLLGAEGRVRVVSSAVKEPAGGSCKRNVLRDAVRGAPFFVWRGDRPAANGGWTMTRMRRMAAAALCIVGLASCTSSHGSSASGSSSIPRTNPTLVTAAVGGGTSATPIAQQPAPAVISVQPTVAGAPVTAACSSGSR